MKALIVTGTLVAGLSAATAYAGESRGPGWEFGVDAIYQDGTDLSFEHGTKASTSGDFGLALFGGYRFNDHFELEFGLDWTQVNYDVTIQSATFPGTQFKGTGDYEAFTPQVSATYNFMSGPITPYITGGVGWTFVDTNIPDGPVSVGCWWDPWWGYVCTPYQSTKSIDDFSYKAGIGVRWDISPGYTLRFGYEKNWFDYGKATSTPDFDRLKLGIAFRF